MNKFITCLLIIVLVLKTITIMIINPSDDTLELNQNYTVTISVHNIDSDIIIVELPPHLINFYPIDNCIKYPLTNTFNCSIENNPTTLIFGLKVNNIPCGLTTYTISARHRDLLVQETVYSIGTPCGYYIPIVMTGVE